MKNLLRSSILLVLLIAASVAFGGVPSLSVTVSDAGGKAAFKGSTDKSGAFVTAGLKPGNYVVQFNSNNAALKGKHYALVVSAGTKKVLANAVPGEKFAGGGVAMRVAVGNVLSITGQVASEGDGKKMVWIPPMIGSNRPGHWVEEGSAEAIAAKSVRTMSTSDVQNIQDRGVGPRF